MLQKRNDLCAAKYPMRDPLSLVPNLRNLYVFFMTRKQKRIAMIGLVGTVLVATSALILSAVEESLVFFVTPAELQAGTIAPDQRLRIGGLVAEGSVKQLGGEKVQFVITDTSQNVTTQFAGILPDLFREGQGVVVEGYLANGILNADEVLAKHDENYMPKEVADALKDTGQWKGQNQ